MKTKIYSHEMNMLYIPFILICHTQKINPKKAKTFFFLSCFKMRRLSSMEEADRPRRLSVTQSTQA